MCDKDMEQSRPNIVFFLIDDMGWKDLGCYDSDFYETPNIDRLAKEGVQFTDAYAACPVCSPTRASILSGKYPATLGVTDWIGAHCRGKLIDAPYIDHLPLDEKSLATSLKAHGYQTWHVGKWHLGEEKYFPQNHGFDVNIGGCEWGSPHRGYFSPYGIEHLEDGPDGEYLTDRLTEEAIRLIKEKRNPDEPFFLNFSHYAVHTPMQAPRHLIEKYEQKAIKLGLDKQQAIIEGENFPCVHNQHLHIQRRVIQSDPVYAAMIENLDANIGRLLTELEEAGLSENTMILFTSDNGGLATSEGSPTCNAPLNEGKGWMYEGGVRVPLIIRWPKGIAAGMKTSVPVTSPDFYPTLLEACGLPANPEQHSDGVSFYPLFEGGDSLDREAIYWHYPHYGNQGGTPGSSVRMGDFKLIHLFEDDRVELYNLREDIEEEHDLTKEYPDLAETMKTKLDNWREQTEAKIPQPNPDYK